MRWLILVIALLLPSIADAACTKSGATFTCDGELATLKDLFRSNIPSAIQEGDTVHVTAGTWVWNGPLVAGWTSTLPGFTFEGASESTTIFQRGASYSETGTEFGGMMVFVQQATSGLTTIKEFTIDTNSSTGAPTQGYLNMVGSGIDIFRVHHVTINNLKTKGFASWGNKSATGAAEYTGLFDHATCNTASSGQPTCFYVLGTWSMNCCSGNQNPFTFAPQLGSNHAVYIEDSVCNYTATADDCFDSYRGGALVFRYNTSNFGLGGAHGADSGLRGNRLLEIYRNTVTAPTAANKSYISNWRSGPSVEFDNTVTNGAFSYSGGIVFTLQRPIDPSTNVSPRFLCDGASAWDNNQGSGVLPTGNPGWPCLDQTGWNFTGVGPNGSNAIYAPAYFWNNSLAGANITYTKNDQATSQATNYIEADRDYYTGGIVAQTSASSPFDGTTGVGFGTLARRPATCTTGSLTTNGGVGGVAYWATDQGSWNQSGSGDQGILYKCTATNTWTVAYTPYTYPHPLQNAGEPPAPDPPATYGVGGSDVGAFTILIWSPVDETSLDFGGYRVYCGTSPGVYDSTPAYISTPYLAQLNRTSTTRALITFPTAGTYYCVSTTFDLAGVNSAYSSEVSFTSPGMTTRSPAQ